MPEIAAICETCANQKDGCCYGFGRGMSVVEERLQVDAEHYHPYTTYGYGYPTCPTEAMQNGMPCREWKEREPKEEGK